MIKETFKIPIYGGILIIMFTDNAGDVRKICKTYEDDYVYASAMTGAYRKRRAYFIALNHKYESKLSNGTITHESLHISNMIMYDIGHEPSRSNDEADAYLAGWVSDMVYKVMKKHNIVL